MAVLSYDEARRRSDLARQLDRHTDPSALNWRLLLAILLNLIFWAAILKFTAVLA
jgi:hypothetical protein